jgi:two-component system, chemotaxis family, chemotaxis protein CheY
MTGKPQVGQSESVRKIVSSGGGGTTAPRALIVDDSPFARKIIRHHLAKLGCIVAGEAENASQGLKMFRALKPNIVTLDVMMPEIDGFNSMAAFRQMRREAPETQIIIVSVVPFEKTRETFLDEGATAYVVKPFNQYSFKTVQQKLVRRFPELAGDGVVLSDSTESK